MAKKDKVIAATKLWENAEKLELQAHKDLVDRLFEYLNDWQNHDKYSMIPAIKTFNTKMDYVISLKKESNQALEELARKLEKEWAEIQAEEAAEDNEGEEWKLGQNNQTKETE